MLELGSRLKAWDAPGQESSSAMRCSALKPLEMQQPKLPLSLLNKGRSERRLREVKGCVSDGVWRSTRLWFPGINDKLKEGVFASRRFCLASKDSMPCRTFPKDGTPKHLEEGSGQGHV